MRCPACKKEFHDDPDRISVHNANNFVGHEFSTQVCPACNEIILLHKRGSCSWDKRQGNWVLDFVEKTEVLYPVVPLSEAECEFGMEVPEGYQNDIKEVCDALNYSPKACAALARRLLQKVLREQLGIKRKNLSEEIDEFITNSKAPSYLTEAIDAIRQLGNFAAHPIKYENTGEIVEVEDGEAEWLIEVLKSLYDFVFVQPAKLAARRDSLNKKLTELGKPLLKGS